jgi:diguanylate cyclase (GGDEF)-like protein
MPARPGSFDGRIAEPESGSPSRFRSAREVQVDEGAFASMRRRPIRNRLILVGVAVVAAIAGAAVLIVEMERQASIDAFRTATTNLGKGMAQQTTQSLASVDRALTEIQISLAQDPAAGPMEIQARMRLKSTFDALTAARKSLSGVESLSVIDTDGNVANTSVTWPPVAANVSRTDFFRHFRAEDDHGVFAGAPIENAGSGKTSFFLARRIDDPHGGFAGLAIGEISVADLQSFYRLAMPPRRSVYVLRSDGVILVRYPPRDNEIGQKIPGDSPWYATAALGAGSYLGSAYFDGTPVLGVVQPLRGLPIVVETSVTQSDILSEWHQERLWVAAGAIAAAICTILLLRLLAGQYRRLELSEVTLAAKNVQLDNAHQQLDATLSNLSHGVCLYDKDTRVVFCNRRYGEIFDLPDGAIQPGMTLAEIAEMRIAAGSFPDRPASEFLAFIAAIVQEGKPDSSIFELVNGKTISGHIQPLPGHRWVVTNEDITERRAAETKIAFLARHDVLTGLANRSLFQERLEQALAMAERGRGFALLYLDLDRFKAVNDSLGHPIGDALLRAVADRLREAVRETDTVARLGGDEFAILQAGVTDPIETTVIACRIVQTIGETFWLDGNQVSVGTSVGIAMALNGAMHPVQLMKNADLALYRAKQEGRGTWRFFEPAMDAVDRARRAFALDLSSALALGQFELHYQPIVRGRGRTLSGFEALLRWRHPARGLVPPGEFIPVAEELGLIAEIGAWVLRQACAEAVAWPGALKVAVNLSARQFRGESLLNTVADAVRDSGISPARLELEITEAVPLQEDWPTLSTLQDLQALGVRVALDDFFTGVSSLSYLRCFPFDTLKIDRSFVGAMRANDKNVVRGIVGLAAGLDMSVTAEGVETAEQFELLIGAGCGEIQGYFIGKPVPVGDVPALIGLLSSQACGDPISTRLLSGPEAATAAV